jgi:VanZ family protein
MNLRIISAIAFFILLAALLALTYYPDLPDLKVRLKDEWFRLDYIGHFAFYAALAVSFLVWRAGWRKKIPWKILVITLIAGLALGTFTEYSQQMTAGRSFNPFDMMYNSIGVVLGAAAMFAAGRK